MKIGLVIYPGCIASGLFAFAEMLEVANQRSGKRHFDVCWVGVDLSPVPLRMGGPAEISVTPELLLTDERLDTILLPGFWTSSKQDFILRFSEQQALLNGLRQLSPKTTVMAYCTAVCLVAETGRLNEHQATSTWWLGSFLQAQYPKVNWRFSQTSTFDQQGATASGVNGYLPIAQELIEQHCGQDVLRDIVELMVMPKPETTINPFQAINIMGLDDKLMRHIYLWVEQTPATELLLKSLAVKLNQTERTLARKVKSATELSCAHFMRLIKLHQAGELLIYGAQPINQISDQLGFSDDTAFRRMFKKETGYTPGDYRQQFKR